VAPLPRLAPKSLTQQSIPWRHLPQPVSEEELKLDKAKCALAGKITSSTDSPEMKFNLVFADCMRSKGYESIWDIQLVCPAVLHWRPDLRLEL
jgi:hypothetical protein